MPARIRPATRDDAFDISLVHERSRAAYYGSRIDPADAERDRNPMWQRMLDEQDRASFVAEIGDDLVGFVSSRRELDPLSHELVALYVLPGYFGTGVARDLYDQFDLVRAGAPASLEVWDANERAKAFYRRRGWSATEQTRPGVDGAPFVVWTLPPGE